MIKDVAYTLHKRTCTWLTMTFLKYAYLSEKMQFGEIQKVTMRAIKETLKQSQHEQEPTSAPLKASNARHSTFEKYGTFTTLWPLAPSARPSSP